MTCRLRPAALVAGTLALLVLLPSSVLAEQWRNRLADAAARSVVAVLPVVPRNVANMDEPEGTGFAVGDGTMVLTAAHVLSDADAVQLRLQDGTVLDAEIMLRDAEADVAVLTSSVLLSPLRFGANPETGDDVCAAGNAFGLGTSLTCGIVSAFPVRSAGFNAIEDFIQTDAAINPGMSGAPLFAMDGTVAGMVSAIFTKGQDGNLGVNFAVSARLMQALLADYEDGQIDRPAPGLLMRPSPPPGETGRPGGEVVRVAAGSPEEQAGIMVGDIVPFVGGLAVRGQPDYLTAMALLAGRATIFVEIQRDGETMQIKVPMGAPQGEDQ